MSDITPLTINNGYIVLPVTTDPNAMVQAALATIAANLPGWVPQEGQLDVLLLEQFAQMASESATVAAQVPPAIFQYFGSLVNIFPIAGAASQATTTWTMVSSAGFTVPAGTLVAYQTLGNVQVQFTTVNAFTVPPGSSMATGVIIQATTTGAVNNSIADTVPVVLVNQLAFVSSVVATSTTSGGANPESLATYLNRLSAELQLLSPRPILPQDFAALATNVAGVYRAMAINLLAAGRTITGTITLATTTALVDTAGSFSAEDVGRLVTGTDIPSSTTISAYVSTTQVTMSHAATGSLTTGTVVLGDLTGVERCVTVAAVDIDGNALSPTVTAALQAYLEGQREINFLVFVISPTYTEIDVTWSRHRSGGGEHHHRAGGRGRRGQRVPVAQHLGAALGRARRHSYRRLGHRHRRCRARQRSGQPRLRGRAWPARLRLWHPDEHGGHLGQRRRVGNHLQPGHGFRYGSANARPGRLLGPHSDDGQLPRHRQRARVHTGAWPIWRRHHQHPRQQPRDGEPLATG